MADQDDKQWLYENGHMPITGGKVSTVSDFHSFIYTREGIKVPMTPNFFISLIGVTNPAYHESEVRFSIGKLVLSRERFH